MPGVDRECITHHHACDCREAASQELRDWAQEMSNFLLDLLPLCSQIKRERLDVILGKL